MNRRSLLSQSGLATAVMLFAAGQGRAQSRGSKALVGSWNVTTTNLSGGNPPPNLPPTSRRLHTYADGGTAFDNSGLEMPAQGVWEYAGGNTFEAFFVRLFRDAQGQVVAINKVHSRIRLITEDKYENEAYSVAISAADNALLFNWRARGEGQRITFELLPLEQAEGSVNRDA